MTRVHSGDERHGQSAEMEQVSDVSESAPRTPLRVLHAVVGHGLPTYFLNTVRSVRATAPADPMLIIDNASPDPELRHALAKFAEDNIGIELILLSDNDLSVNYKVGSLYSAYEKVFAYATDRGFDLLHLVQADFQMLWWDDEVVVKAAEIFEENPHCVNIMMQFLSKDKVLAGSLARVQSDDWSRIRGYGLTDTGIFHLGRWQDRKMSFGPSEQSHAKRYLSAGFEVICHPWPTDAPIPWPAVVRGGVRRGREIASQRPYLLKPLSATDVARVKNSQQSWLEDVCVPWGWVCATPMWVTSLDSIDYWVLRYRDAKKNGFTQVLPRWEARGVNRTDRRRILRIYRYRPSLFQLFVAVPIQEVLRRLARHR